MSKAKKQKQVTGRATAKKGKTTLPEFFDIVTIVSLAGFAGSAGGGYILGMLYTRAIFTIMMFCLVSFASSFAISHFMRENPVKQVFYFKSWLGMMISLVVIAVLSLGLPY